MCSFFTVRKKRSGFGMRGKIREVFVIKTRCNKTSPDFQGRANIHRDVNLWHLVYNQLQAVFLTHPVFLKDRNEIDAVRAGVCR